MTQKHPNEPTFISNPLQVIVYAGQAMWQHNKMPLLFITALLAVLSVSLSIGFSRVPASGEMPQWLSLLSVVNAVLNIWLCLALLKLSVDSLHRHQREVGEFLVYGLKRLFMLVILMILTGLMVLGGLLLLVIPGLYFMLRLTFAPYVFVHEGLGPIASIKRSWLLTKGNLWEIVGVGSFFGAALLALLFLGTLGYLFSVVSSGSVDASINIWLENVISLASLVIGVSWLAATAQLYVQAHRLHDNSTSKPKTDRGNYWAVFLPFAVFIFGLFGIVQYSMTNREAFGEIIQQTIDEQSQQDYYRGEKYQQVVPYQFN